MKYYRLFHRMREESGLSIDALATLAHCHRNTVLNVEKGRPVKFKTIANLMNKLGFAAHSPEMASMALLWIENMSGVALSSPPELKGTRQHLGELNARDEDACQQLLESIRSSGLIEEELKLLAAAAADRQVMQILASVQALGRRQPAKP